MQPASIVLSNTTFELWITDIQNLASATECPCLNWWTNPTMVVRGTAVPASPGLHSPCRQNGLGPRMIELPAQCRWSGTNYCYSVHWSESDRRGIDWYQGFSKALPGSIPIISNSQFTIATHPLPMLPEIFGLNSEISAAFARFVSTHLKFWLAWSWLSLKRLKIEGEPQKFLETTTQVRC